MSGPEGAGKDKDVDTVRTREASSPGSRPRGRGLGAGGSRGRHAPFCLAGPAGAIPKGIRLFLPFLLLSVLPPAPGRAAPAEAGAAPFRFVVMGDNRPAGVYAPQPPILEVIFRQINELGPAFVVSTGDSVYGYTLFGRDTRRQYRDFLEKRRILACPFYSCPGNHDVTGRKGWKYFRKYMGKPYRAFRYGGCLFVLLNTEEPDAHHDIRGKQLRWLKARLEESEARGERHRFVFMHHPLFIPRLKSRRKHRHEPEDRDALHALFAAHHVDAVFAGHEHYYHRQVVDGVVYIITAGGGAPLYASPEEGGVHHFVVVDVSGEKVSDRFVPVEPKGLLPGGEAPAVRSTPVPGPLSPSSRTVPPGGKASLRRGR